MDTDRREIKECLRVFIEKHRLLAMRVSYVQDFDLAEHSDYWAIREDWIKNFKDIVKALVTLETPGLTKLYAKSLSLPTEASGVHKLTYRIGQRDAGGKEFPHALTDKISDEFWHDLLPEPEDGIFFIQNILEKLKGVYQPSHEDFTATIQDHGVISRHYKVRFIIAGLPSIDPYSSAGYFGRSYWITAIESARKPGSLTKDAALEWLYHPLTSYRQDGFPFFIKNPNDLYVRCSTLVGGKFKDEGHNVTNGGEITPYWANRVDELDRCLSQISKILERLFSKNVLADFRESFTPLEKACFAKSFSDMKGVWLPFLTKIFQPRNWNDDMKRKTEAWRIQTDNPGHLLLNLQLLQKVLEKEHKKAELSQCDFVLTENGARVAITFSNCQNAKTTAREVAAIQTYKGTNDFKEVLRHLQACGATITSCSFDRTLTVNIDFGVEQIN